jgi:hypothetical protein
MLALNCASIAFFNFFGVSITKHMSASTRMVLDSLRTLVIWGVSILLGWETFCFVQVIGFVVLLAGTMIYNKVWRLESVFWYPPEPGEEALLVVEEGEGDYTPLPEEDGTGAGRGRRRTSSFSVAAGRSGD